jgi:hypothetical protein
MKQLNRRAFLTQYLGTTAAGLYGFTQMSAYANESNKTPNDITKSVLMKCTIPRQTLDAFLSPEKPSWAKFDPELGYLLKNSIYKDGMDGSFTFTSFEKYGARKMVNYAGKTCRMNTYGDSFTQCHQVSDGETWQEILGAHFGEPIRNYGIGGYGFYQAYRRMLREEATPYKAEYIILNLYDDDHIRSITPYRYARWGISGWTLAPYMFHGNPWVYLDMDLNTGKIFECDHSFKTPQSLYNLCNPEFVYETFKNSLELNLLIAENHGYSDKLKEFKMLAEILKVPVDFSSPELTKKSAETLHWTFGFRASEYILEKSFEFAKRNKKKILLLLSFCSENIARGCSGLPRFDQPFIDYLKRNNVLNVDAVEEHTKDFAQCKLTPEEYVNKYFIGHYNPVGNHFFAYAIKDTIVSWLEPKPLAYSSNAPSWTEEVGKLAR